MDGVKQAVAPRPLIVEDYIREAGDFDEFYRNIHRDLGTDQDQAKEYWDEYWYDIVAEQRENEAMDNA